MSRFIEFLVGLLFGWGLLLSGMTDPGKVQGFLDLFGDWDPSLAFVMGGAIAVGVFAFALARRRTTTFMGGVMQLPSSRDIDTRLVVGSLIFGAGWGLAGFCRVPASWPWPLACRRRPCSWPRCWSACSGSRCWSAPQGARRALALRAEGTGAEHPPHGPRHDRRANRRSNAFPVAEPMGSDPRGCGGPAAAGVRRARLA